MGRVRQLETLNRVPRCSLAEMNPRLTMLRHLEQVSEPGSPVRNLDFEAPRSDAREKSSRGRLGHLASKRRGTTQFPSLLPWDTTDKSCPCDASVKRSRCTA